MADLTTNTNALQEIKDLLEGKALPTQIPELTNPAVAADILSGKEAINNNGTKVTGTMPTASTADLQSTYTSHIYNNVFGLYTNKALEGYCNFPRGTWIRNISPWDLGGYPITMATGTVEVLNNQTSGNIAEFHLYWFGEDGAVVTTNGANFTPTLKHVSGQGTTAGTRLAKVVCAPVGSIIAFYRAYGTAGLDNGKIQPITSQGLTTLASLNRDCYDLIIYQVNSSSFTLELDFRPEND